MKRLLLAILLMHITIASNANITHALNDLSKNEDYIHIETFKDDINNDGYLDYLVALEKRDKLKHSTSGDASDRVLRIYIGTREGVKIPLEFKNILLCSSCGGMVGDPFIGIVTKPPYFTIEHYGGDRRRWASYVTFKYNSKRKDFFLHRVGLQNFHYLKPKEISSSHLSEKNFGSIRIDSFRMQEWALGE